MLDFIVSVSNIFIDDIIYTIDKMNFSILGGAGPHALSGCRIWWDKGMGLIASAGRDFDTFLCLLQQLNIDLTGLKYLQDKTTRSWQIYQNGQIRVSVYNNPDVIIVQAIPNFIQLSEEYQQAKGYHILWTGKDKENLFKTLEWIRNKNPYTIIAFEPSVQETRQDRNYYSNLFKLIDVFSPNLKEGEFITKRKLPKDIISSILDLGCNRIALRMGSQGSYAGGLEEGFFIVPAVKETIVDVTGAGNAYVGGLLSGLSQNKSFRESLAMATVSAYFEIQQFGVCLFSEDMIPRRDQLFRDAYKNIKDAI